MRDLFVALFVTVYPALGIILGRRARRAERDVPRETRGDA